MHPLRVLVTSLRIDAIAVILPAKRDPSVDEASRLPKVCSITRGGETRQRSLQRGLSVLPPHTDTVIVQDAARPFLEESYVEAVLEALDEPFQGAICAVPAEDSLKLASEELEIVDSVPRQSVWRAQTPQAFRRGALEQSLERAEAEGFQATDCSELLSRAGHKVRIVQGHPYNLKVTAPEDLMLARAIFEERSRG